jgi:hypothetical protein
VSAPSPLPADLRRDLVELLADALLADLRERPSLAEGGMSEQARAVKSYATLHRVIDAVDPQGLFPPSPPGNCCECRDRS